LVLNNSKVFPARLWGESQWHENRGFAPKSNSAHDTWKCLVYPGKRLKEEQYITFSVKKRGYVFSGANDGTRLIRLEYEGDFWAAIDKVGHIPLPPYINRPDEDEDRERYQTIYAREPGSVAAPTAGLHFSPVLMDTLKAKGVQFAELTLHVGIGTFRPVKTDDITQHLMHSECVEIPETQRSLLTVPSRKTASNSLG
jgi:S-adenosylmethionine:tRNA ribosyltransferase-isomerase